jgi:hypothetical protein
MKITQRSIWVGAWALGVCWSMATQAALLAYEFSGTTEPERFQVITSDPFADLFGVPRAGISALSFALRLVIDTDDVPVVMQDTSAVHQVRYEDAIVSATLHINGVPFGTLRRPSEFFSGAFDESEIRITNSRSAAGTDGFLLTLGNPIIGAVPPLYRSHTVPFNQTISGIFIDDAEVHAPFQSINISGPGLLDTIALPTTSGAFSGARDVAIGLTLISDTGLGVGNGSLALEITAASFSVSAVPLPPSAALFIPAIIGLIRSRRVGKPTGS